MFGLEQLSNELFELVIQHLSLQNIRNLRLTSRNVSYKATQDTFRSFSRSKTIDLTRDGLQTFAQMTELDLACGLREIHLAGIVYNPTELEQVLESGERFEPQDVEGEETDAYEIADNCITESADDNYGLKDCTEDELQRTRDDLRAMCQRKQDLVDFQAQDEDFLLLTRAFRNIAAKKPEGLDSLALEVITFKESETRLNPRDGKAWKWIFQTAARTFKLAMTCLRDSHLLVERFNVFAAKPQSLGVSITCDALASMDWNSFRPVVKSLKALHISISDCIVDATEGDVLDVSGVHPEDVGFESYTKYLDLEPLRPKILAEENVSSLSTMLTFAEDLEELEISFYKAHCRILELHELTTRMRRRFIYHLARSEGKAFSRLHKLRLGGAWAEQVDLTTFLQSLASLRELELSSINLGQHGSFTPVMAVLKDMNLDNIYMEDLWVGTTLVLFDRLQSSSDCTQVQGDYLSRNTIRVWGPDTTKQIACAPYRGRSVGSGKVWRWRKRKLLEYGGH